MILREGFKRLRVDRVGDLTYSTYHLWNSPVVAQVVEPEPRMLAGGCMKMVSFQIKA